jgi:predicted enzyme related to lactoylglutathione lyase
MLKGLLGATIWSEDLNNLLPFYRDVLELKIAYGPPGFVGFGERADSGGYVGAYLGLGTHSQVKGEAAEPYRHMVGLESDDVDADFERLSAAGVEFIEQPTDYGRLRIATLKDPEGNIVQILQPIAA